MKKLVLALLFLFFISSVLALQTTIKQEYKPGETLIAEITGNFIDNLKSEDILFYSGRVFIPMIYDLAKINDKYYLYAVLPIKERNYSLIIKNAHYTEAGLEYKKDLQFDFSAKSNTSSYNVNPGFIIANKDFSIKVTALTKDISLKSTFNTISKDYTISESRTKTIPFSISGIKGFTKTSLKLEADNLVYEIPAIIFAEGTSVNQSQNIEDIKELRFSKSHLNFSVIADSSFQFTISLSNTGQEDIKNIKFDTENLSDILKITPEEIDILKAGDLEKINLTIKSKKEGKIYGELIAVSENSTAKSSIEITTVKDKQAYQEIKNNSDLAVEGSCSSLNGFICGEKETCKGNTLLTIDGDCCVGTCEETKTGGGTSNAIAIILIVIVLGILGFFIFKKIRQKRASSEDIIKEKSSDYESRFKAGIGNLTRT